MAELTRKTYQAYNYLFDEIVDQRTKHLPLLAKPYQGLIVLGLYLMFVLKWGPKYMQNRPPYNLDKVLIFYNAFQVVACFYVFVKSFSLAWGWKYKWICEPVDYSENGNDVIPICYLYFMLKIIDLFDTVFFVLRKKFNQVSFLHIYHHTGMVLLIWGAVTYVPGGHGTLVGVINSFVHVVMYSYYLITVANPSVKQQLWWKKYITQLQIMQFFLNCVHMGTLVFVPDCAYPRWTAAVFLPQNVFMLILFLDFYRKSYMRKPKEKHEDTNGHKNGLSHETVHKNGSSIENVHKNGSKTDYGFKNGNSVKNHHNNGTKKEN